MNLITGSDFWYFVWNIVILFVKYELLKSCDTALWHMDIKLLLFLVFVNYTIYSLLYFVGKTILCLFIYISCWCVNDSIDAFQEHNAWVIISLCVIVTCFIVFCKFITFRSMKGSLNCLSYIAEKRTEFIWNNVSKKCLIAIQSTSNHVGSLALLKF